MGSSKGITWHNMTFWIIIMLFILVASIAVYVLLTQGFVGYFMDNIASETKICETFERNPILGTVSCPE